MKQLALGEVVVRPVSQAHAEVLALAEAARAACLEGPKGGFVAPPVRAPRKRGKREVEGQTAIWKRPVGERLGSELHEPLPPKMSLMAAALAAERRPCPEFPRRLVRCEQAARESVYLDENGARIAVRVELPEGNLYFARIVDASARMSLGRSPPDDEARRMIGEAFPGVHGEFWRGCIIVCTLDARGARAVVEAWLRRQEERLARLQRETAPPRPRPADSKKERGKIWHKAKAWAEAKKVEVE